MALHRLWKVKIISVIHAGLTQGMEMLQNILYSLAPSIRAASRMASGMALTINCRIRNTPKVPASAGSKIDQ